MSTTSRAAITEMVREKFGDKDFNKMIGKPTSATIQLIVTQISKVSSSFTKCQWEGNHSCIALALALVLDETKMRSTSGINDLNCSQLDKPATINRLMRLHLSKLC